MEYQTEINWYDLKDYEILYLDCGVSKDLISRGIKRAGSLSKLGIKLNSMQLYDIFKNNDGISVKVLKRLLDYLQLDYDFVNDSINEIRKGNISSIRNPKFPIDLSNSKMGYLIGNLMSDGCLYYDKSRKNLIRTKYYSNEKEGIEMFVSHLQAIFGDVHFNQEFIRNCIQIRIGNGIVGEVFKRAGVTIGKKYKLNKGLPWIVKKGSKEIKKSYLSAVFDDEGSVGNKNGKFPYIIVSRNIHINFSNEEKSILYKYVVPLMNTSFFPTKHSIRRIPIGYLKEKLLRVHAEQLLDKIIKAKPKILIDESNLLKDYFGINNRTYVISLQLTDKENFSLKSSLLIGKKSDVLKFYKEIGFSLTKKQKKLKEALISGRLLDDGA